MVLFASQLGLLGSCLLSKAPPFAPGSSSWISRAPAIECHVSLGRSRWAQATRCAGWPDIRLDRFRIWVFWTSSPGVLEKANLRRPGGDDIPFVRVSRPLLIHQA